MDEFNFENLSSEDIDAIAAVLVLHPGLMSLSDEEVFRSIASIEATETPDYVNTYDSQTEDIDADSVLDSFLNQPISSQYITQEFDLSLLDTVLFFKKIQ